MASRSGPLAAVFFLIVGFRVAKKRAPEIVHVAQTDSPMQMVFALAEVPDDRIDIFFKRPLEGADTPDPQVAFVTFYSPRQGIPHRVATNHYRFAQTGQSLFDSITELLYVLKYELPHKQITVHIGWPRSSWLDRLAIGVMVFSMMKLPDMFPEFHFLIEYVPRRFTMPDVAVIIPAGGAGRRMGGSTPKQFLRVGGLPIIAVTVRAFERVAGGAADHRRGASRAMLHGPTGMLRQAGCGKVTAVVEGGKERQDSVRTGLAMITGDPGVVLIHDAVRPFVSPKVIAAVIRDAARYGAAVVGVRVKDTIKREGEKGFYQDTLPRHLLWAVQTPQGFTRHLIEKAHAKALRDGFVGTDDAMLVERMRLPVRIVEGDYGNAKITTREDLLAARVGSRGEIGNAPLHMGGWLSYISRYG